MASGCMCAICYEDFVPASDILQAIAGCGHVFHELCLQQWVSLCPNERAPTCPLCKKACFAFNIHRLYFQSSSDDSIQRRDTSGAEGNASGSERMLISKMEGRAEVLNTACSALKDKVASLERAQKTQEEQTLTWREDALNLRELKIQLEQSLTRTREELRKATDRAAEILNSNASISKKMAAMQLTTDLNLSEEDMIEVTNTSRGFGTSLTKDEIIEAMAKSLFVRNKLFKDLMQKCQELGVGGIRAEQKSERLSLQLKRTKARLREQAKMEEDKENAVMRSVKTCSHNDRHGPSTWRSPSPLAANAATGTPNFRKSRITAEEKFCSQLEPRLASTAGCSGVTAESTRDTESVNNSDGRGGVHVLADRIENTDITTEGSGQRFSSVDEILPNRNPVGASNSGANVGMRAATQLGSPDFGSPETPSATPNPTVGLDEMEGPGSVHQRADMLPRRHKRVRHGPPIGEEMEETVSVGQTADVLVRRLDRIPPGPPIGENMESREMLGSSSRVLDGMEDMPRHMPPISRDRDDEESVRQRLEACDSKLERICNSTIGSREDHGGDTLEMLEDMVETLRCRNLEKGGLADVVRGSVVSKHLDTAGLRVEMLRRDRNYQSLLNMVKKLRSESQGMLPVRHESGLGRAAPSFAQPQPQSQSQTQTPINSLRDGSFAPAAPPRVAPERGSTFIASGADGRGGRVTVYKPLGEASSSGGSSLVGLTRTKRLDGAFTRAKRPKTSNHVVGSNSAALKIEHFYGRR